MVGLGLGIGPSRRRFRGSVAPTSVPSLRPGLAWTGVPGSGYSIFPQDPARLTAKPVARIITPPNQHFTDGLLVGIMAAANAGGSLRDNLGLKHVVAYCEGSSVTIDTPTLQTIADANGIERTYLGWWIKLQRRQNGTQHVYFEAVPTDDAMQSRIIGPYSFTATSQVHDFAVSVAPTLPQIAGQSYQSISAALGYLASANAQNPLVTIVESGNYTWSPINTLYAGSGYCTIRADVPVTIHNPTFTTDTAARIRPRYDGIRLFGQNITVDFANILDLYREGLREHWLDGVKLTNSGGRGAPWRYGRRNLNYLIRGAPYFTECDISNLPNPCVGAALVRGCRLSAGYSDIFTDANCVVGNEVFDWDSSIDWALDVPSLTIAFSGAELTATIALSGANDSTSRTMTATWGSNSATFTFGNSQTHQTDGTYLVSHVAEWLNGLGAGFVATVLDNSRRASSLSLQDLNGTGFPATNVKTQPLSLCTMFDVHADWYQANTGASISNVIAFDNKAVDVVCQNIFLTGASGLMDALFANNTFANKVTERRYANNTFLKSQLAATHSHVIIAHNTMPFQAISFRTDMGYSPDSHCLIGNNVFLDMAWNGPPISAVGIPNNFLLAGAMGGAIGPGTLVGGASENAFVDAAAGKFAPRGLLETSVAPVLLRLAANNKSRSDVDAIGAFAQERGAISSASGASLRCVQFPSFNRVYAGLAGNIAFPKTNLVTAPLLSATSPAALFLLLQVPHERTKFNRRSYVMGTAYGTTNQSFGLYHYGDDYFNGSQHDTFHFRAKGSVGDLLDMSVDVQARADAWQLVVVSSSGSGTFSIASYAAGLPKIAGTTQVSSTAQLNALAGTHVLVGDLGNALGSLAPWGTPAAGFGGAIAAHGFVLGTAGNDDQWQAIAEGADIVTTLSDASAFKLLRDYRSPAALSTLLSASAPGDNTSAGVVQGEVSRGGSPAYLSPKKYLDIKRLPDGYVICPPDGAMTGTVAISGRSRGVSGDLYGRVVALDGTELIEPFRVGGIDASITGTVEIATFPGWGYLEFWPESDPSFVVRMNARIGCGDKFSAIGQSQVNIALHSSGLPVTPSGLASFATHIGAYSDPRDSLASPVARASANSRSQLFVLEPQMTGLFNGVTAAAERIQAYNQGRAICIIDTAVNGTSAQDWIDDTAPVRLWSIDIEVANLAGKDRVPVWQWFSSDSGHDYSMLFDGIIFGSGPYAKNRRLYDGSIQIPGYKLAISPPSRATDTGDGPFNADTFGFTRSYAQAGQIAWAMAHPDLAVIGPPVTDMAVDNTPAGTPIGPNPNLGGGHASQALFEGCYRLGLRMGEAYLRARGLSPVAQNPRFDVGNIAINADRTQILLPCLLPNPGSQLKTQDGAPPGGFEISSDGGLSWSRLGFAVEIVGNNTVRLTKDSGTWPAGIRLFYLRGGPFSYGTAVELSAPYKSGLYDGCNIENGLGVPVMELGAPGGIVL